MKKIVITGASGQLGRAFVEHLVAKNYEVYCLDMKVEQSPVERATYHVVDITSETEVAAFYQMIGSIDALINNAGIGVFTPFEERTVEDFKRVMDVNLLGTFLMCREAIKIMKKSNSGKIINIGSIYGVVSSDPRIYGESKRNNSEVYSMTKAGVIMLSQYLAAHYGKHNIQINTISPGGVFNKQTDEFVENYTFRNPTGKMAAPSDLFPAIDFLLSVENSYTNGQNIVVDGGFTAW